MYQKLPTLTIAPTNAKKIAIDFNGGMLTSDAGTLLLQQVEQKMGDQTRKFAYKISGIAEFSRKTPA